MSQVANTNFLQPTGFKVVVDRKKFPNFEWFAQSVDHPSVGVQGTSASYKRITEVPMIGDQLEFPEVTFNLLLDENMQAYTEIFDWLKRLVAEKYTTVTAADENNMQSECDITMMILNSSNSRQKSIVYRNAFPVNIGSIPMGAEAEPSPILLPVSFQYTYFDII